MNASALSTATAACLASIDSDYEGCEITSSQPISGGYSRLTFLYDLKTKNGLEKIVLQYVPAGSTGLVRVDRTVERDLLQYLTQTKDVRTSELIAADVAGVFFDSAAFIFKAEAGRPFLALCQDSKPEEYGQLNRVVAETGAALHSHRIDDLPVSIERPASWDDYLTSQIDMFRRTEAECKTSRPFLRYVAKWLDENRPPAAPLSLVHGDFQVSNMMTQTDGDTSVLVDWELAHIGDPREDLGWLTMVCNTIPPNILAADVEGFYKAYREKTGWSEAVINPITTAYFLIISSIRTHMGMMKASEALAESPEQAQSVLAAYYLSITSYQHTMWMGAIKTVEQSKGKTA